MSRRALAAVPDHLPSEQAEPTRPTEEPGLIPLEDYPPQFLVCRAAGRHTFPVPTRQRWTRVVDTRGRPIEYRHGMVCEHCTLMVTEVVDARTGGKYRSAPHYAEGYLRSGERLPASRARLEQLRRLEADLGVAVFETVTEDRS